MLAGGQVEWQTAPGVSQQARLGQRLQEILPVHVAQKDVLTPVTPAHDVVNRSRILDAQLPWHQPQICPRVPPLSSTSIEPEPCSK